ncbi:hypothetical protein HPB47_013002, partial [Ixodes persulcatus]
ILLLGSALLTAVSECYELIPIASSTFAEASVLRNIAANAALVVSLLTVAILSWCRLLRVLGSSGFAFALLGLLAVATALDAVLLDHQVSAQAQSVVIEAVSNSRIILTLAVAVLLSGGFLAAGIQDTVLKRPSNSRDETAGRAQWRSEAVRRLGRLNKNVRRRLDFLAALLRVLWMDTFRMTLSTMAYFACLFVKVPLLEAAVSTGHVLSMLGVDCFQLSMSVYMFPYPVGGLLCMPVLLYLLVQRAGTKVTLCCTAYLLCVFLVSIPASRIQNALWGPKEVSFSA